MQYRTNESYQQIKNQGQAQENYAQQQQERKRNALVLSMAYLRECGYMRSVVQIQQETNVSLDTYDVCDNVDLETVISEYEQFYKYKFGRGVKLVKRLAQGGSNQHQTNIPQCMQAYMAGGKTPGAGAPPIRRANSGSQISDGKAVLSKRSNESEDIKSGQDNKNNAKYLKKNDKDEPLKGADPLPQLAGRPINNSDVKAAAAQPENRKKDDTASQSPAKNKPAFKPVFLPPPADMPGELLPLYDVIRHEILSEHPEGGFSQVVGLDQAKQVLKEAVLLPGKYPSLFTGVLRPWRGCLMFSAPGNGKSLLARSLACECGCVFFNVSAASLLSKYYGESEKLVRCLFMMAREYERAVIFIDELDCLMQARGGAEHEASRRIKTQLLVEIDGLKSAGGSVFVLAATNLPWTIDSAMLRRLEKRVHVQQPDGLAREEIVFQQLGDRLADKALAKRVSEHTDGWSASDVCALCREAAMTRLRSQLQLLENGTIASENAVNLTVGAQEIEAALKRVKPSYGKDLHEKYVKWEQEFGA